MREMRGTLLTGLAMLLAAASVFGGEAPPYPGQPTPSPAKLPESSTDLLPASTNAPERVDLLQPSTAQPQAPPSDPPPSPAHLSGSSDQPPPSPNPPQAPPTRPPSSPSQPPLSVACGLELPDPGIATAYERAAAQNVLAAVNPKVFCGYWSVCADGQGFGHGNTYPSLDGHQMTDALLWLGQVEVVKANFDYVRSFQRKDGALPLAILPSLAGKPIGSGNALAAVDPNGGLYQHWVPGNPLAALADPTYIQNADVIFRHTQDRKWLADRIASIHLAAAHLASLITREGAVQGAGYYIERPARIESDGVAQCHAVDALRRAAALHSVLGEQAKARDLEQLAGRVEKHFVTRFWVKDHFAEYFHPERGLISSHGLTDVDWSSIALGIATPEQQAILWPQLVGDGRFHYGGMPTGISTRPETYEAWEFTHADRHDLAAMGRVWYLEAWARARMGDADGLLKGLRAVCRAGMEGGYFWRERYHPDGKGGCSPAGAEKYCEYPANLIRIVNRFLLGIELRVDGTLVLSPCAPADFWEKGFGRDISWRGRSFAYRMDRHGLRGTYSGGDQRLCVRFPPQVLPDDRVAGAEARVDGRPVEVSRENGRIIIALPARPAGRPCTVVIEGAVRAR